MHANHWTRLNQSWIQRDQNSSKSRRKKGWLILASLLVWVVWISGVFGNSGILQAYKLSQVRRDMALRVSALENERQRLQDTLYALEHDRYVQEQTIREVLGFVRAQEIVFEFKE